MLRVIALGLFGGLATSCAAQTWTYADGKEVCEMVDVGGCLAQVCYSHNCQHPVTPHVVATTCRMTVEPETDALLQLLGANP